MAASQLQGAILTAMHDAPDPPALLQGAILTAMHDSIPAPEVNMSCAGKPSSFFVVPDCLLVGAANVVSITSEAGPYPGVAAAASANLGRLLPLQSGSLTVDAESVEYQLIQAGGVDSAEFIWRRQADTTSEFFGADDPRRWLYWHTPIAAATPGSDNCATVFSATFRTLLSVGVDGTTNAVTLARRNVDETRYDDWTITSFILDSAVASGDHNVSLIELPDGRLLMAVRVIAVGGLHDFDVYQSADGGATWIRTAQEIIIRAEGTGRTMVLTSQVRMARAGEYIRLCWVEAGAPETIHTTYSTDRGATWSVLTGTRTVGDTTLADDPYPFHVVGVDEAGLFMLSHVRDGALTTVDYSFARADADWTTAAAANSIHTSNVLQVVSLLTAGWLYVWVYYSDQGGGLLDGWAVRRVRPQDAQAFLAGVAWEETTPANILEGAFYHPGRLDVTWTGSGAFFYGARREEVSGLDIGRGLGWYWGGWDQHSLGEAGPSIPLDASILFNAWMYEHLWHIGIGRPTEGTGSPWSAITVGGGADTLTMEFLEITGAGAGDARFYRRTPNVGNVWAAASSFGWLVRLDTGDSSSVADNVAVQIIGTSAGSSVDISLRISPTGILVVDNEAASTLATLIVTMDTGASGAFREVRWWMATTGGGTGTTRGQLLVYETDTGIWHTTAVLTLTQNTATPAANSRIDFGQLGQIQATTMRSWWRELGIIDEFTGNQSDSTNAAAAVNPDDLFGWPTASSISLSIEEGLAVAWAGAGGVIGDSFDGDVEHQHPAEAMAIDSPRIDWRSGGADPQAAQTIILDADSVAGLERWAHHDAIAVFGTNGRTILVDYDDDVSFGSATAAETIDTTAFGGVAQAVGSVAGNVLVVSGASLPWESGECFDMYVRMIDGAAIGKSFKVTSHRALAVLQCGEETATLSGEGVAAADTFVLFRPHGALEYVTAIGTSAAPQRYMRLRFTDADTAEGDHRLGSVVVGRKLSVEVPLDWAYTDNQQPNVTRYRTRGAVSWGFREGPLQRTIIGRVVGDAERFRDRLRFVMGQIDFEARPAALVIDDERPDMAMLGRVVSGNQQDNAGWYRDGGGTLRTAGDLSITFEEEV